MYNIGIRKGAFADTNLQEANFPDHIKWVSSSKEMKFKSMIRNYFKDETAVDDSIAKILFVVVGIAVVGAIGWFAWNAISNQANIATNRLNNNTNPGAGAEFNGNPFQ